MRPCSQALQQDQFSSVLPVGAIAVEGGEGHFHWGRLRIAKVGVRNEKVPPWTMGSLKRKNVIVAKAHTIYEISIVKSF